MKTLGRARKGRAKAINKKGRSGVKPLGHFVGILL